MADTVIRAEGLTLSLRLHTGTLELLKSVDLSVQASESVAILGRSGSGKTTLLTLLGLMGRPDEGLLSLGGTPVHSLSDDKAARLRNRAIGFVFQDYSLVPHLSVAQNVMLPFMYGAPARRRRRREAASHALEQVGLARLADARPAKLSGGEQQRVAIARALVRTPPVILADEPTGALDVDTGDQVIEVLRRAASRTGACLVVVTHDLDVAGRMDSRYELQDGTLAPRAASASPPLRRLTTDPAE